MRILIINKFLHPNGGSETYILKLGAYLNSIGHEVQYFGMEHEGRQVGNKVESYTSDMDFHSGSKISKLFYPVKIIYSLEARKKLRVILSDFNPEVVHLNNFNYQLTPSVIVEIVKWRRSENRKCKIIYTAHDYQLICPNHLCHNPNTHENCEKCLDGRFFNCMKGNCIHGSMARSAVGMAEAYFWRWRGIYKYIDKVICCSKFLKEKMESNEFFKNKTVIMRHFVDRSFVDDIDNVNIKNISDISAGVLPEKYVFYFGRYAEEKGMGTLLKAIAEMPDINFVFAGGGPFPVVDLKTGKKLPNLLEVGFQDGDRLKTFIKNALFTILPSEWYEPFGLTIIESQLLGTPVVGADIGGISEIIENGKNGILFESGNVKSLCKIVRRLWGDDCLIRELSNGCLTTPIENIECYCDKLIKIYKGIDL